MSLWYYEQFDMLGRWSSRTSPSRPSDVTASGKVKLRAIREVPPDMVGASVDVLRAWSDIECAKDAEALQLGMDVMPEQAAAAVAAVRRELAAGMEPLPADHVSLRIGSKLIDLANPRPDQIDMEAIMERLAGIRRFSGHPGALTVYQHSMLVRDLARKGGAPSRVITWAFYHDAHEGIIGDIPSPLKRLIRRDSAVIDALELALDEAIAGALGIPNPTWSVRREVKLYDQQARAIERRHMLAFPVDVDAAVIPPWGRDVLRGILGVEPPYE